MLQSCFVTAIRICIHFSSLVLICTCYSAGVDVTLVYHPCISKRRFMLTNSIIFYLEVICLLLNKLKVASIIRRNSARGLDQQEGLVPIMEDWHAKLCFGGVMHCVIKKFITCIITVKITCSWNSTLYNLQCWLAEGMLLQSQKRCICLRRILSFMEAYICIAVMQVFNMSSLDVVVVMWGDVLRVY